MEFAYSTRFDKRKKADALVVPFWKGKNGGELASSLSLSTSLPIHSALKAQDFKGKEGETLVLYTEEQPEPRLILLGLGSKDKVSVEILRRSYGSVTKLCLSKKWQSLNVVMPEPAGLSTEDLGYGVAEGLLLPNYQFAISKQVESDEDGPSLLQSIMWIGEDKQMLEEAKRVFDICEGVYYVRDLVNGNADDVTPQYLAEEAKELAKRYPGIKATVFDKKRIEKEKMDLLLAVNRGSALDPAFIILEYHGNPKSKDHTVLVGKGITYDTGGLNIKSSNMEIMKCDMAGGAACFGIMIAASLLKLKANITALIPTTENCTDAKSFKPGDVYTSYTGKTVEMMNSDAEGRLILADALGYASDKLKPTRMIDLATLTGAIDIAIGPEATGMMSNDDELANALTQAGQVTFERVWRMPLFEEYKDRLKSDIADLKSWNGRTASANVAATFLQQFVGPNIPWAHLDIASTAYSSDAKKYLPKYATGVGVRLIIELLEQLSKS